MITLPKRTVMRWWRSWLTPAPTNIWYGARRDSVASAKIELVVPKNS